MRSDPTPGSAASSLPDAPNFDWLRKQAKRRLQELRQANPAARLTDAQFDIARHYGFSSWRSLKAHVDSVTVDGQLFDCARTGDVERLAALLDEHPERLHARTRPVLLDHGSDADARWSRWDAEVTPLHLAAAQGHAEVVRLLLAVGADPSIRDSKHNCDARGWAESGRVPPSPRREEVARTLEDHASS